MSRRKKKGPIRLVVALLVVGSLTLSLVLVALPRSEFQVSNLEVKPRVVLVGSPVEVSADIKNLGKAAGDYQAVLTVNEEVVGSRNLKLAGGGLEKVSFVVTPARVGEYKVRLGAATTTFLAQEGILPSLYAGDQWLYKVSTGSQESQVSYQVLGETTVKGIVTYVVQFSGKSPQDVFDKGISFLDKGTLYPVKEERSGTVDNIPVSEKLMVKRVIEGTRWPLTPGLEWKVSESENFTSKKGLVVTTGDRQFSGTFKVEGKEEVTTTSGVFDSFRVVARDKAGNMTGSWWYSDKVKREVKRQLIVKGVPVTYELLSYQVSAIPPATPPSKLEFPPPTEYEEPTSGYTLSYPADWRLVPEEKEPGTVYVYTVGGTRGLRFAWVRVRASGPVEATLDKVYRDIMKATKEADPKFELVVSTRVEAELPWYEVKWTSWMQEVKLKGKTIIALKGERLFIVTGWVQEAYSEEYGLALERVMESFGIRP